MHRNILYGIAAVALIGLGYLVVHLLHRLMGRRSRLNSMQLHLWTKIIAISGMLGCSSSVVDIDSDPGDGGSDDSLATETDSSADTGDDSADDSEVDSVTDSVSDSDVNMDSESDSDGAVDTAEMLDTDPGACSGVTCYEKVAVPADRISIDGRPNGTMIRLEGDVLTGTFDTSYAPVPCFRFFDGAGVLLASGNIKGIDQEDGVTQFEIVLPSNLSGGVYQLFLYGTTCENVQQYDTYPAKQYSVKVPE